MNKLQVVDYSDRLNAEGKYKLEIGGYTGYGNDKKRVYVDVDISDLTLDQIGVIGGFLNATFDDANMSSITGAGIRRLESEEVTTNETKMKETNVFEKMAKREELLTHMLPTTLFCEECGITETSPSFGQQYCRYCGTKFKYKPWIYKETDDGNDN